MKILSFLLSLLLVSTPVFADVYKWVDEKGQVHYQDHPQGTPEGSISIDDGAVEKVDAQAINQLKTKKLLKDMEKARKQRDKTRRKKELTQRKQEEKCLKQRSQIHKLEARMQKHYSEFSNERPASYEHQSEELAERKKYLDEYCN